MRNRKVIQYHKSLKSFLSNNTTPVFLPTFNNHTDHSLENLQFLGVVSENHSEELRWKITIAYYTGLHLMHAYLSTHNIHPKTHSDLKEYLAPTSRFTAKLDNVDYLNYENLEMLSRKARYDSDIKINDKHLSKAIEYLDKVIVFVKSKFTSISIPSPTTIYCTDKTKCKNHTYFNIVEKEVTV